MLVNSQSYAHRDLSDKAKSALAAEDSCPELVYHSVQIVLGQSAPLLLPETRRKAFYDLNVEVAETNYDKYNATLVLLFQQTQFWEMNVFENTVLAFNDVDVNPDLLQLADPAYIVYALYTMLALLRNTEAGSMLPYEVFEKGPSELGGIFDPEPVEYIASMLYENGIVCAPPELSWTQERLDQFYRGNGNNKLCAKVHAKREKLPTNIEALRNVEFTEDEVGVQLAKYAALRVYVVEKLEAARKQLRDLLS